MYPELEIVLLVVLLIAAVIALTVRNLLAAVVALTVFSFTSALIYAALGAVDVGFTEATVGGGVTGVLLLVLIFKTTRRSSD
ncbi:MAG: hydrogenase subunit MbhD domain-containing protein [Candidatus Aminicenantales bacterium]|jgi:energy-converting hydrogenase B subunit D